MELDNDARVVLKDIHKNFKILWELLGKEYRLVYHPEGCLISLEEKFTRFLVSQNIMIPNLDIYNNLIHPAIYISYLAAPRGALVSLTSGTDFHQELADIKITLNEYQNVTMDENTPRIIINRFFYDEGTDNFQRFFRYNGPRIIKRDPQLRRKLKIYFESRGIPFDETKLKNKAPLDGLYGYLDADELIMLHQDNGTYFEMLPEDMKYEIIDKINNMFLKSDDIEDNNLTKFMKNSLGLVSQLQNGGNLSEIIDSIESAGIMQDIKNNVNPRSPVDLINYLCSSGMYDVVTSLEEQLNNPSDNFSDSDDSEILDEINLIKNNQ